MRNSKKSFTVPPGEYWLGDPCYSFNQNWSKVLDKSNFFQPEDHGEERGRQLIEWKGGVILAFSTAWGDGTYLDDEGNEYGVDAGLIGLVSVGVEDRKPQGVRRVKFTMPTECGASGRNGGVLVFGDIEIDTESTSEEDYTDY